MSNQHSASSHDPLAQLWQASAPAGDGDRAARHVMARVWQFDQKIFWRNFREYAAGLVLMVVFAGQIALDNDRTGGVIGLVCVGFVMAYLWWKHRGLQPLDPADDLTEYRRALIQRYDDQIRLLRSVPYWYLLPLFLPGLWFVVSEWQRVRWLALVPLAINLTAFSLVGWLNVSLAVRVVRKARNEVAGDIEDEGR